MSEPRKVTRAKKAAAPAAVRYEINTCGRWTAVDRGNVLKDGCLHWQIGAGVDEEYGISSKGRWREVTK